MKLLITGASGLYGSKLAELAVNSGHQVFSVHSQHPAEFGVPVQLDIADNDKVEAELRKVNPEVVVHAATMTDVDKCELNREFAWKVNFEGTRNVAEAAKACGAFLVYISTDYVFDGSKGCYVETDLPSPLSYYGYSKLKAEELVQDTSEEFCVARPSVIYGAKPAAGKVNFALWLLDKLKNGEKATVFVDQWNSPTLNSSLAEMTLEVAERRLKGVYHLSGATRISRFDYAVLLAKTFGLDASCLVAGSLRDFSAPAKRPRDSSLSTAKAERTLRHKPIRVEAALERLKQELAGSA
jgi:dTDP-4-dehydrorhamnose reductase